MMTFRPYTHRVQYYETDRMGITHHSNYIRWMEEARVEWLEQAGWGLERLEAAGILIPTTAVSFRYLKTTTFRDEVTVDVRCTAFNGVTCTLTYTLRNADGETVGTASSEHCFMTADYKFLRMKRTHPEFYAFMQENTVPESAEG